MKIAIFALVALTSCTTLGVKDNSGKKVVGLAELSVNEGYDSKDVEEFLVRFTKFVKETEPGTYDFGYFISADGKSVNLVEKYYTSNDFLHHLNNFESNPISEDFLAIFTIGKIIVAGNVSDELREKFKGYGAEIRAQVGGWID